MGSVPFRQQQPLSFVRSPVYEFFVNSGKPNKHEKIKYAHEGFCG